MCVFYCERGSARVSYHRAAIGRENTRELLWDDLQEKQNNERGRERVCVYFSARGRIKYSPGRILIGCRILIGT